MALLDLKNACFQVPIHKALWKSLHFVCQGTVYQFKVFCFGISTAFKYYQNLNNDIIMCAQFWDLPTQISGQLTHSGIVQDQLKHSLERHILSICNDLGIVVNQTKSELIPTQQITYLGMFIDSEEARVFPTGPKINKFRDMANSFLGLLQPTSGKLFQDTCHP